MARSALFTADLKRLMRLRPVLLVCTVAVTAGAAPSCRAADIEGVQLLEDGATLRIQLAGGRSLDAPKLGAQDGFDQPRVSADHRHAGWLALYPNKGASYSQPVELVVMDRGQHLYRFAGDFGMVFGWCFTPDSQAVVYRYGFSHGQTFVEFDMRRIRDGRLLRHFQLEPVKDDEDTDGVLLAKAPPWTRCAQALPEPS